MNDAADYEPTEADMRIELEAIAELVREHGDPKRDGGLFLREAIRNILDEALSADHGQDTVQAHTGPLDGLQRLRAEHAAVAIAVASFTEELDRLEARELPTADMVAQGRQALQVFEAWADELQRRIGFFAQQSETAFN